MCFFNVDEVYYMDMQYAQAEDSPLDLYYLMDLSLSMKDDKNKLSELSNLLAERMQNITSNFRLGFGSFVDKVVMPYVSTLPAKLVLDCQLHVTCRPIYVAGSNYLDANKPIHYEQF